VSNIQNIDRTLLATRVVSSMPPLITPDDRALFQTLESSHHTMNAIGTVSGTR
jgi:hypothetical protein